MINITISKGQAKRLLDAFKWLESQATLDEMDNDLVDLLERLIKEEN